MAGDAIRKSADRVTTLSVCANHPPVRPDELGPDGTLHVTAARLAELRRESSVHIGQCRRGPIVAIPVSYEIG